MYSFHIKISKNVYIDISKNKSNQIETTEPNAYPSLQIEKDNAYTEIEILKEKLDKALYASQKLIDEKDNSTKEYEKMLEKYDR